MAQQIMARTNMTNEAVMTRATVVAASADAPEGRRVSSAIQAMIGATVLCHLSRPGRQALVDAGAGMLLDAKQRSLLRDGWNGPLIDDENRLNELGRIAHARYMREESRPERELDRTQIRGPDSQQQINVRNIAERENDEQARAQAREHAAREKHMRREHDLALAEQDMFAHEALDGQAWDGRFDGEDTPEREAAPIRSRPSPGREMAPDR